MTARLPWNETRLSAVAEAYKAGDTKPYQPTNGTEGHGFIECWCEDCDRDQFDEATCQGGCEILARSMAYRVGDDEYPPEWVRTVDGVTGCLAFKPREVTP